MAQPDLQRTVTRNTNDITALYELSTEIKQTVEITNQRVGRLDHTFHDLSQKVHSLDQQVGSLGQQVSSIGQKVGSLDQKVGSIDQRVGALEKRLESQDRRLAAVISVQQRHGSQLSALQLSVDRLSELHNQHSDRLDKQGHRLDKLTDRMDKLTVRMDKLTVRMDDLTVRVESIDNKIETGLASLGAQLTEVLTIVRGGAASEKT
jgi:chromosome segregation ATPase